MAGKNSGRIRLGHGINLYSVIETELTLLEHTACTNHHTKTISSLHRPSTAHVDTLDYAQFIVFDENRPRIDSY